MFESIAPAFQPKPIECRPCMPKEPLSFSLPSSDSEFQGLLKKRWYEEETKKVRGMLKFQAILDENIEKTLRRP